MMFPGVIKKCSGVGDRNKTKRTVLVVIIAAGEEIFRV